MRRLVLGLGLGVIVLNTVLLTLWFVRTHGEVLEGGVIASRSLARGFASHSVRLLQHVDESLREIATWRDGGVPAAMLDKLLAYRRNASPFLMDLMVLDAEGNVDHWSGTGRPDVKGEPYYRAHQNLNSELFIGDPEESNLYPGRRYFGVSRALRTADGTIEQIVVAIIDVGYFEELLAGLAPEVRGYAVIGTDAGTVIARSPGGAKPDTHASDAFLTASADRRLIADEVVGWREPVGAFPLQVAVRMDRNAVLGPWQARLAVAVLAMTLGGGTIIALMVILLRKLDDMTRSEARNTALIEQSLVGIFALDGPNIEYVNPRFAEIFGAQSDAMRGRPFLELVVDDDRERVERRLARWVAEGNGGGSLLFCAKRADGVTIDVETQGRPVRIDGRTGILGVLSDVTEKERAQRKLKFLAFHDPLTELPNRSLFFDRLTQAIGRGRREGTSFALFAIDLDGFKEVNDTRGHDAGDIVLRVVAHRLQACVRQSDTVARTGGDEFIVLVHGLHGRDDARAVAEKVVSAMRDAIEIPGGTARIGASVGAVVFPADGMDTETLVSRADAAMYAAKTSGKDGFRFFDENMPVGSPQRSSLIEWCDDNATGIAVIDEQHRHLVALVNAIARALTRGDDPAQVRSMLADMAHFARVHFATEEALMDAHAAPYSSQHRHEHEQLLHELDAVQMRFDQSSATLTVQAIKDWLLLHTAQSDRALGRHLSAHGVV